MASTTGFDTVVFVGVVIAKEGDSEAKLKNKANNTVTNDMFMIPP